MKKIGLIGGTGPESTIMYYKNLNTQIDKITNGKEMPDLAIESVNFHKALNYVSSGQYKALTDYLAEKVNNLKTGGAEIISLTAGTMHIVYNELVKKTNISLISIPKVVCEEAVSKGYKKIGLLGTIFTMENDFMKNDFINSGIEIFVPNKEDREFIGKKIFEELELGIIKESTLNDFNSIISKIKNEHNIEAVVLGCTELPLLLNNDNCVLPCLDSVEIHIQKLIKLALGD
ncbi:MAG: amino acid racemase [Bacteroidales bacterium]|nr:amino acid racemase [Bacteroidales bacterium]